MPSISSHTSPLQQAEIDIQIEAPIANTKLTQTFVNQTGDIIEAVYNFPVPRQAVIMQVIVTINGEVFNGLIQPVAKAEESYEEGIEDGKRSVLVRDIGDGQHELRAGNLAPEDCLIINITIAQLMQAQPGGYRYFLPTVIAPKYGHTRDLKNISHKHSILASYPFSANLRVAGEVAVACLSHGLQKKDNIYRFSGALDQDIVLTVASNLDEPYVIQALHGDYPCGLIVLPPQASVKSEAIASIVLLIDCSGSMTGLSMQQTRAGLSALLTQIPENSEVSIMCFGSSVMHVTKKPLTINSKNRNVLLDYVSNINADMGGTEIWDALKAAQAQCKKHKKIPEIVLLTDGQVWENTDVFDAANLEQSEHSRINTIGIGSAVSENIVIQIAEATQGQWMLVHPNEPMDERICHFIAQVSAPRIDCLWEADNTQWNALPISASQVYGTTGFVVYSADAKTNEIVLNNEVLHETELTKELGIALQRLAGQQQVRSLDEADAVVLSLKLGLVNQHTSFVMVHEQSIENADGLPTLVIAPQMNLNDPSPHFALNRLDAHVCHSSKVEIFDSADDDKIEYLSIPSFLRKTTDESPTNHIEPTQNASNTGLFKRLFSRTSVEHALLIKVDRKLSRALSKPTIPTLEQLIKWGLDNDIAESIREYCIHHSIDDPAFFIAKFLLWLNGKQQELSAESEAILQMKIKQSTYEDFVLFSAFVDELDKLTTNSVRTG